MELEYRVERILKEALDSIAAGGAPPLLTAALNHAVFPGGARVRPQLCLTIASACGESEPELAEGAATAIELVHCASLVHDDLPCFDDAEERRGLPSVHRAFGEPLAVLVGDQLIVLAFQALARAASSSPFLLPTLIEVVARGVGMPRGIIAGQAWESEPRIPEVLYRRAKTGALFEAAAAAGAIAAGANGREWRLFGQLVGEAYQIADDIQDVAGCAADLGKPTGRDAALGRPNTATSLGLSGSSKLLEKLLADALAAIPTCKRPEIVRAFARRMMAQMMRRRAAPTTSPREPERVPL